MVTTWIRAAGSRNMLSNASRSWRISVPPWPAGALGDGAAATTVTVSPRPSIPGPARAGCHTRPGTGAGHSRRPGEAGSRKPRGRGSRAVRRVPELPVHPATETTLRSSAAASRRARRERVSRTAGCCRASGLLRCSPRSGKINAGTNAPRGGLRGRRSGTGERPGPQRPVQGDLPQFADPRGHLQADQPASRYLPSP